jgi:deazaflavin-dependent oxidoreductase (nitroreductase family)
VVKVLVLGVVTLGVVFIVGMRTKHPKVLRAVRCMNRAVFNPKQMESAGTPGAYASIIEHVGRTSGTEYQTPVGVVPTDDGFVIALPYGSEADWLKNVLAAGSATIVHDGATTDVVHPEVVPIEQAAAHFSEKDRKAHRVFAVDQALRVRRAG